jgi:hypothetical protein
MLGMQFTSLIESLNWMLRRCLLTRHHHDCRWVANKRGVTVKTNLATSEPLFTMLEV